MLDIRTLLLATPEDRYASTPAMRTAELRLFPLLREARRSLPIERVATMQEVQA